MLVRITSIILKNERFVCHEVPLGGLARPPGGKESKQTDRLADRGRNRHPPAVISDWEIWACAQQQVKQHGGRAGEKAAERVVELARAGDAEGVATWRAIADRIDQLIDFKGAGRARH